MKFAVMGSGGVGGYFAGRLAAAGLDTTLIARGAHLEAIREDGLRIESALGDAHIHPIRATDTPADIGPVDYVLFATKLWDTKIAGEACQPLIGPDTAVISLQNGVDPEIELASILGQEHVMGGVAQITGFIAAPGVIRHTGDFAKMIFGEISRRQSPRVGVLLEALDQAGIDAEISNNIVREIWEKFIFLVGFSALTSLTRRSIGPVREDPDTRALLTQIMSEATAIARAKGIDLDEDFIEDRLRFVDRLPAQVTSSMAQDLEKGNRLELDWLSGAVARMGRELSIGTPANDSVCTALNLSADGTGT